MSDVEIQWVIGKDLTVEFNERCNAGYLWTGPDPCAEFSIQKEYPKGKDEPNKRGEVPVKFTITPKSAGTYDIGFAQRSENGADQDGYVDIKLVVTP